MYSADWGLFDVPLGQRWQALGDPERVHWQEEAFVTVGCFAQKESMHRVVQYLRPC
jgi:hypothetical protein